VILATKPLPRMPLPAHPQPNLPQPGRKQQRQLKNLYRLALVLAVFGILAFGAVAREANIWAQNRSLEELTARIVQIEAHNVALRLEVARLSSSAHIERVARERLGMREPTAEQVLTAGVHSGGN